MLVYVVILVLLALCVEATSTLVVEALLPLPHLQLQYTEFDHIILL